MNLGRNIYTPSAAVLQIQSPLSIFILRHTPIYPLSSAFYHQPPQGINAIPQPGFPVCDSSICCLFSSSHPYFPISSNGCAGLTMKPSWRFPFLSGDLVYPVNFKLPPNDSLRSFKLSFCGDPRGERTAR